MRSPPNFQLGFVAMFGDADDSAPKIASDPLARRAAPVTSVVPRNVRRVTLVFSFEPEDFLCMLLSVRPRKLLSTRAVLHFCGEIQSGGAPHALQDASAHSVCCAALFLALVPTSFTCPLSSLDQCLLPLAHQNGECLLEIFAES